MKVTAPRRALRRALLIAAVGVAALLPAVPAPAGAATGACSLPRDPGLTSVAVQQGTTTRYAQLYVPRGYKGTERIPLLLWLHGSTQTGFDQISAQSAAGRPFLQDHADAAGYAILAPDGAVRSGQGWAWNIPGVPLVGTTTFPPADALDDVQYVGLAIDAAAAAICVDDARVYATGASGGGRMASQLACDLSTRIAAIAPVMGVRTPAASDDPPRTKDCRPARKLPVLAIHGRLDPINQFANDDRRIARGSSWSYGTPEALRRRAVLNGCDPAAPTFTQTSPNVRLWSFRCPAGAEVQLYDVVDGGHTLPGSAEMPALASIIGPTNRELDTPRAIWDFVKGYRLS